MEKVDKREKSGLSHRRNQYTERHLKESKLLIAAPLWRALENVSVTLSIIYIKEA